MKKIFITAVFFFAYFLLYADDRAPYDFYPREYQLLTAQDWPRIHQFLQEVLALNNMEAFKTEKTIQLALKEGWKPANQYCLHYLFSRVVDIEWNKTQKKEVINYLQKFVAQLLSENSFLKDIHRLEMYFFDSRGAQLENIKHTVPARVLWAIFNLDEDVGISYLLRLWKNKQFNQSSDFFSYTQAKTLWTIVNHKTAYQNAKIYEGLAVIEKGLFVGAIENRILNNKIKSFKLKHQFFQLKDAEKVLDHLIQSVQPENLLIYDRASNLKWFDAFLALKEVYPDYDVNILFQKSKQEPNATIKYGLFYGLSIVLQEKLFRETRHANDPDLKQAIKFIKRFYRKDAPEQKGLKDHDDFLYRALASLENYKAGKGKTYSNTLPKKRNSTVKKSPKPKPAPIRPNLPSVIRPEEQGEDLSPKSTNDLMNRLATSTDQIELRKVALVLGDRALANTLTLTTTQAISHC